MTVITEAKKCLACGKQLKGRIDKKFCDDYCRNGNYLHKGRKVCMGLIMRIICRG
jgi:hypothetical protein